jgi:hypothetical protein
VTTPTCLVQRQATGLTDLLANSTSRKERSMIKAIETRYAGCRFRSRLEARWAVFFNALNIPWEYEPQGFQTGAGLYLPDFWLPEIKTWVEVKGSEKQVDVQRFVDMLDYGQGPSGTSHCGEFDWHYGDCNHGILFLGPIPRPASGRVQAHSILLHHKGVIQRLRTFDASGHLDETALWARCKEPAFNGQGLGGSYDYGNPGWTEASSYPIRLINTCDLGFDVVDEAYRAARSARFEHGERGA